MAVFADPRPSFPVAMGARLLINVFDLKVVVVRLASIPGALVAILISSLCAQAADCRVEGPLPKLDSKPIFWTFELAGGGRCLRGLRSSAMLLDSVTIGSPAKIGEATINGYSFAYRAPRDFKGEDSFSVEMSGRYRGVRGTSTINVRVLVR